LLLDAGFDNPEKRAAQDEDELCESVAAKFIYLPELLSYIVQGRNIKITALSFTLSLSKPPAMPCRRFLFC